MALPNDNEPVQSSVSTFLNDFLRNTQQLAGGVKEVVAQVGSVKDQIKQVTGTPRVNTQANVDLAPTSTTQPSQFISGGLSKETKAGLWIVGIIGAILLFAKLFLKRK